MKNQCRFRSRNSNSQNYPVLNHLLNCVHSYNLLIIDLYLININHFRGSEQKPHALAKQYYTCSHKLFFFGLCCSKNQFVLK